MRKLILLCWLSTLSYSAHADHIPTDYQLLGSGVLKYGFFKIYDAELYAPERISQLQAPLLLQLEYPRDIPAERLVKVTFEQMEKQSTLIAERAEQWRQQLTDLWPDIKEDDTLSVHYHSDGTSSFYHNHQLLGRVDDIDFSYAFIAIWLAENTNAPDLRAELLGLE